MKSFRGNISNLISAGFMLLFLGGGSLWLAFNVPPSAAGHEQWGVEAFFGLLGTGAIAFFGYVILECLTSYQLDADGITRRGWNGARTLRWSEITHFEAGGGANSQLTLTDFLGNKLCVQRGLMSGKNLVELNQLLDANLAPIRERQLQDMGGFNNVYHPKRGAAWAGVIMSVMVGGMLAFFLAQPVPPDQQWAMVVLMIFIGGIELLFLYMTVLGFTHSLIFTEEGITDASVFRTRYIPFARVSSVMSRTVSTKNGSYDLTTVEGDGQKIMLTSQAKDYEMLTEYIRTHVDTTAQQQGEVKAEEIQRKNDKQTRILLPIIAVIYMVFLVGMGISSLREGNERMGHYLLMDAQGKTTIGRILGRTYEYSGKHTTHLLQYAFDAPGGQHNESASPVSWDDYQTARIGMSARVIYVPGRKDVSRLEKSIGRNQAEGKIRSGYFLIGTGIVLPVLLAFAPFMKRKKAGAAPTSA